MEDMIATGKSGDRFVLYCRSTASFPEWRPLTLLVTGHGGQVNDLNGDEIDGLDESTCFKVYSDSTEDGFS